MLGNASSENVELYNLEADIGEKENLAGREPDRARAMAERVRRRHQEINPPK